MQVRVAGAGRSEGNDGLKQYDVATNGISLHVTEQGEGPAVLFCHGFPDTSYTWRRQMNAIASAGYRAIAPDRGATPAILAGLRVSPGTGLDGFGIRLGTRLDGLRAFRLALPSASA